MVLHDLKLVESTHAEPWTWWTCCNIIHDFSVVWRVGTPTPVLFRDQMYYTFLWIFKLFFLAFLCIMESL